MNTTATTTTTLPRVRRKQGRTYSRVHLSLSHDDIRIMDELLDILSRHHRVALSRPMVLSDALQALREEVEAGHFRANPDAYRAMKRPAKGR